MSTDTDRIRMLNDELRQHLYDGGAIITAGIAALGSNAVMRLVNAIASFNDFCTGERPSWRTRLWCLRFRRQVRDVQDRLLRQGPQLSLTRSRRSDCH